MHYADCKIAKTSYMTFPRDNDNETLLFKNKKMQVINKVTLCVCHYL